jgi:hypothetical protein
MILYYTDTNGNIWANPKDASSMSEYLPPYWGEIPLPQHKNIADVVLTTDGTYYTFYNNDGTVNQAKEDAKYVEDTLKEKEAAVTSAIDAIQVQYAVDSVVYMFSGHLEAQNRIAVALAKIKGNTNKKQNWFTANAEKVLLSYTDLEAILVLIDTEMEAILESV